MIKWTTFYLVIDIANIDTHDTQLGEEETTYQPNAENE